MSRRNNISSRIKGLNAGLIWMGTIKMEVVTPPYIQPQKNIHLKAVLYQNRVQLEPTSPEKFGGVDPKIGEPVYSRVPSEIRSPCYWWMGSRNLIEVCAKTSNLHT